MPLLALLLARRGIPVLIHGRNDFATRVDPSTLFAELAIPRADSAEQASELIARHHVAFIALVNLLPNLDKLLALRLRLGLRNSGHTLAKLIDPAKEKSVRLVTVTHPEYLQKMRIFLANSKATALLFRSTEGEAFANPKRRPELIAFKAGQHEMSFPAEDGGTSPIEGMPDVAENETTARWIRDMLAGHVAIPQPILDQVAVLARLASEV